MPVRSESLTRNFSPASAYFWLVLTRPKLVLAGLLLLLAFSAYHAKDFRLDASAD